MELLNAQDDSIFLSKGVYPIGRIKTLDINAFGFSSSSSIESGISPQENWNYSAFCNDASAMNLYLSDIYLDDDDVIYIYSGVYTESGTIRVTKEDLGNKNTFATPAVKGKNIKIKLVSNEGSTSETIKFKIAGLGIIYDNSMFSGDGNCHVDVSCSEADNWQEQKDAVMRLIIKEGGILYSCTGTLMNNTSSDQRRLVLSALHCVSDATNSELDTAVATFNYERNSCGSGTASETNFLVGLDRLGDSNDAVDGQVNPDGSDFVLLELEDEIPVEWNPYWAGWNAVNAVSSSGVAIHHPLGGAKKISTYNTSTVSTFLGAPGSHWAVNWVSSANGFGVTEPGSSGCPLFNSNGLVIGTLTGGFSNCSVEGNTGPDGTDYFGKLFYHWQNNPNTQDEKLKEWLDPLNSGTFSLSGSYNPQVSLEEREKRNSVQFFPNPAKEFIKFKNVNREMTISVYDFYGRLCLNSIISPSRKSVSLETLNSGVYFVKQNTEESLENIGVLVIY